MVGMAPAPNGSSLPYGNEIRRLIIAGTPNYGADEFILKLILDVRCVVKLRPPTGVQSQADEMKYGARFLWDLDHKWLVKHPIDPGNLLVVAGTADGLSDGLVRTASAALPEDFFLPVGHILYVPYQHCHDIPIICNSTQIEALVYVRDANHLTYRIIKEFLSSGQPPTQSSLGPQSQPSNQVLDDSLLLLRMVDKVTETPIVPPPITLKCLLNVFPSSTPTIKRNQDPDAGTVTVVGIQASLWSSSGCSVVVKNSPGYSGTTVNDITMFPGLPQVRAIELTQR
jgi:hypothetical protein